jgi:hypothetical protein
MYRLEGDFPGIDPHLLVMAWPGVDDDEHFGTYERRPLEGLVIG